MSEPVLNFETAGGARTVVYGTSKGMHLSASCMGCKASAPVSQKLTDWARAHAETCRAPHPHARPA